MRFLLETVSAVRTVWPRELPLSVRLSVTDWIDGGCDLDDSIALARALKATGDVDLIDASSGGLDPRQRIPVHPGYQVPFAERIRRDAGIATAAVGLISAPEAAEEIIANGRADLVVLWAACCSTTRIGRCTPPRRCAPIASPGRCSTSAPTSSEDDRHPCSGSRSSTA